MTANQHLKMAFVGCGGIAQAHWQGIQSHAPRIKITAAVDVDPARAAAMAEQTGAEPFTSLEKALERGDFGAVDLMLPHHVHEETTIRAFEAGKHVVLEKPMATTVESCERIMAAAGKAGTVFMVAEQSQYSPFAVKVQELLQDKAVGEIITARAMFSERPRDTTPAEFWRYDKEITGGGVVIDGGLHWIRPMRMWLGDVDEVVAVLGYPIEQMEGESMAQALFRFRSGIVANFGGVTAKRLNVPREDFRIIGAEGVITVDKGHGGRVHLYNQAHPDGLEVLSGNKTRGLDYGLELADFARAVLDGADLAAGPEESVADLRVVLAMYRSADSHRWEKV